MRKRYFLKNSIVTLLIISILIVPFGSMKQAEAQYASGYASGIGSAVLTLPLCKNVLRSGTAKLFGQIGGTVLGEKVAGRVFGGGKAKILSGQAAAGVSQLNSISTYDANANAKLDAANEKLDSVQESTGSLNENDTCLKNIGRLVVKMMLQKLTLSTINWINSGFDGKPAFIQDPGKFFNDIAKNEILQFGLEINNPQLFPFGKAWLQNQAAAFNNKFADNARYSLDEMIASTTPQYTAASFQVSFDQGGWGAWSAMTQYPQNNPLGFQLMASDELQKRLEGTVQSTAEKVQTALNQADGFLGDERCVDPQGVTKEENQRALNGDKNARRCNRSEYVTPGKLIAERATSTIKSDETSLLQADDLNDAFAAIADALLARFSANIFEKGYANLNTSEGADGSFVYNPESARPDYTTQTEKDFTSVQLTSSWLGANPNFNIRTDLTQALIDEQRTYADKLQLQNKELNSTTTGGDYAMVNGVSNAYGLIPAITQLDYCIPGPHPGWEQDSRETLDAVTNPITPLTRQDVENIGAKNVVGAAASIAPIVGAALGVKIGGTLGSIFPGAGTVIGAAAGAVVGASIQYIGRFFGIGGDKEEEALRQFFAGQIQAITGVSADWKDNESKVVTALTSKQGAVQALNVILERYIDLSHIVYNPKILPEVTKAAATEYNKLEGYGQIIKNNEDIIYNTKNTVNTLTDIKAQIVALNQKRSSMSEDQYENELKPQINAFGRVSANMVNGDDIASADNLLKQIIDEKNYIYNDLLKGPRGCEKDLEVAKQGLPTQLYQTKRMEYPFPILYEYPTTQVTIADPWNSGYVNTINAAAINPPYGPGLLSYYRFQTTSHRTVRNEEKYDFSNRCVQSVKEDTIGEVPQCELWVGDLIPLGDNASTPTSTAEKDGVGPPRSLGVTGGGSVSAGVNRSGYSAGSTSGPFEYSIGVY